MHRITLSAGKENARDQGNSHYDFNEQCYVCGEPCLRTEKTFQFGAPQQPISSFSRLLVFKIYSTLWHSIWDARAVLLQKKITQMRDCTGKLLNARHNLWHAVGLQFGVRFKTLTTLLQE